MKNIFTAILVTITLAFPAFAGNPSTGLSDPVVIAPTNPTFSWSGPYAGLTYGQSNHKRQYTRTWDETRTYYTKEGFETVTPRVEEVERREEIPYDEHRYTCTRGSGHFGYKCDVSGFTLSPEFNDLDTVNRPWREAEDQTVRYENGYSGLWMGADETYTFTMPLPIDPIMRSNDWAQISYEMVSGVNVVEYTELVEYDDIAYGTRLVEHTEVVATHVETYTVNEGDTTLGAFVGYRHQFDAVPFVLGAEFNYMDTDDHGSFEQLGVQAGFAAGRVLPFVEVGYDHYAGGVDVALGKNGRVLLGVRTWETHDGDDSGNMIRLGWAF